MLQRLLQQNLWTNTIGLSRSLLAFGTLSTLLANEAHLLFPSIEDMSNFIMNSEFSLFYLLKEHLHLAKWVSVIILLMVISGWKPMLTCIPHWWVAFSFFTSSPIVDGGDQITSILTLLLIPVCITDKRRWHWENNGPKIESLDFCQQCKHLFIVSFLIVIKVQIAIIYFHAATAKLSVEEWTNGTALYYWFTHDIFGMGSFLKPLLIPILLNPFIVTLMTWSVIVFELLMFAACLMNRRNQKIMLILGISFHFSIFVIHGLFSFFFAMTAAILLYLTPAGLNLSTKTSLQSNKSIILKP
ncbi:MAG: sporulation-delaying protein SdpB family protein [Cyclobacteriaceae bacterium]